LSVGKRVDHPRGGVTTHQGIFMRQLFKGFPGRRISRVGRVATEAVGSDRRYTNLEIVRIIAASLVIFLHLQLKFAVELGLMPWLNDALRSLGSIGVDLFFVVSGFVIALNVDRGDSAPRFAWARVRRILPSYWLLTALAALVVIAFPSQFAQSFDLGRFVSSLFFVNEQFGFSAPTISLGWTLNLEMRFYLIVAISVLLIPRALPRFLVLVLAFAGLVAFVVAGHQDPIMFEFGFGFAAFGLTRLVAEHRQVGLGIFSLGIVGVFAWLIGLTDGLDRWISFGVPSFLIVLGSLLLPQAKNPVFKRLGFASYSTYLTQWFSIPVAVLIISTLGIGEAFAPVIFVVSLFGCVAVGVLYSVVIDEKLYGLTKRIGPRKPSAG
jgi:exopolysaccharide production protein ExoZ